MKVEQLILIVSVVTILVWNSNSYFFFLSTTLVGFTQYTFTCFNLYNKFYLKKLCIPNTRKRYQAHFQSCYQTPKNEVVFQKMISGKWHIFQKTLMLNKQSININPFVNDFFFFLLYIVSYHIIYHKINKHLIEYRYTYKKYIYYKFETYSTNDFFFLEWTCKGTIWLLSPKGHRI